MVDRVRRLARPRDVSVPDSPRAHARLVVFVVLLMTLLGTRVRAAGAHEPEPTASPPAHGSTFSWRNPNTWPVLPVPNISVDPTRGMTFGLIPTWMRHGVGGRIVQIIAPDIVHNAEFGWGAHARILAYPSADTQWSVVAGVMQRVESKVDALYETGLLRNRRWSVSTELDYDRSGTARFFGVGNASAYADQSVYTDQQLWLRGTLGWNATPVWQVAEAIIVKKVRVGGAHLPGIASITNRFPGVRGMGTTHEILDRIIVTYDTRNSITLPTRGVDIALYGGAAGRHGLPDGSLFTEAGMDMRLYWSPTRSLTIASHLDLRYMPSAHAVPFWALSSIGGDRSMLGGPQTLRGFGQSRFYDRNAFAANIEFRQTVFVLNALRTRIELQVAPFYDTGRVFADAATLPLDGLHNVFGVGFRGVAAPFIVGYVDVGYGGEGAAVFTGINYPY